MEICSLQAIEEISLETAGDFHLEILVIPGDGSCLFNSIAHQLYHFPITPENLRYYSELLRSLSVNYIQEHLSDLTLQENIRSTSHELFGPIAEDILYDHYLQNLRYDHAFWGGVECIYALANIYQVRVHVFVSSGSITTISPTTPTNQEVNIFYRNGDHYDSILAVLVLQNSEPLNDPLSFTSLITDPVPLQPEIDCQPQNNYFPANSSDHRTFTMATWNVNGSSGSSKQSEIDTILENNNIDLLCLQEIRSTSRTIYTEHYKWFVNVHNRPRGCRGTAILIRKNLLHLVQSFASITENISVLQMTVGAKRVTVVCFHSPSEGQSEVYREYARMSDLLRRFSRDCEIIMLGDWNAHLGFIDRLDDCPLLGTILHHYESNSNGRLMYDFLRVNNLEVLTTKLDKSTKTTGQRGDLRSQIDHIIRPLNSPLFCIQLKAIFYSSISDHKLIKSRFILHHSSSTNPSGQSNRKYICAKKKRDVQLLKHEHILSSYQSRLNEKFSAYQLDLNINTNWNRFTQLITETAHEILYPRKRKNPMPPETSTSLANYKRAKFVLSEQPTDENRLKVKQARLQMNDQLRHDEITEHEQFFQGLQDFHITDRIKKTYSYVKSVKRNLSPQTFIPIHHWEELLSQQQGPPALTLPPDLHPTLPPPAEEDVRQILMSMKTGKKSFKYSIFSS